MGKSLNSMPTFTIKGIELHREKSGKQNVSTRKTLERGWKFREERYISADSIFTAVTLEGFHVKAKCKASMKKEIRNIEICLDKKDGKVVFWRCSCPAGNSSYCNHIMALLFEIANYSLNGLLVVPQEVSCTSKSRQWEIPSANQKQQDPIMTSSIRSACDKKGISSTLYDPRINFSKCNVEEIICKLQEQLKERDSRIGFVHSIKSIDMIINKFSSTNYGEFRIGSTLSHQLLPFDHKFK